MGQHMSKDSPLISLCMIAGNESMHVRRCLKTFSPCADEIIVVRACGSLKPDDTLEIAEKEFGARVAEYKNGPGRQDWPHVDNFANARNMAFDLARGRFQLWVDFDDIAEPDHVLGILEAAEDCAAGKTDWDIFHFGYVIPYSGAKPLRERLVRRGAGRWQNAVHECITDLKDGCKQAYNTQLEIVHAPMENKVKMGLSSGRNIRILESIQNKTHGEAFFYFMELCGVGKPKEALEAAKKALSYPDLGDAERYEVFLNLASMAEKKEVRRAFLWEAVKLTPWRREAFALLCGDATNCHEPELALALARLMVALPRPVVRQYTHRDNVYGFGGDLIHAGAMRLNGMFKEADELEAANFEQNGAKISLLHATRGRFQQAALTRKYWYDTAIEPGAIEHIFAIDEDDKESFNALGTFRHVVVKSGGGCVAAWNAAAAASSGSVLIQLSDDWIPPIGWDKEILKRIGNVQKSAVLAISDGHRKDGLLCMAILTRWRYNDQKDEKGEPYLFHPDFKSMFSDTFFSWKAYKDGVVIDGTDFVIEHRHPLFDSSIPEDKTYAESNAPERYEQGGKVYERLTGEKLPPPPSKEEAERMLAEMRAKK